jgi:hypothetical protein
MPPDGDQLSVDDDGVQIFMVNDGDQLPVDDCRY